MKVQVLASVMNQKLEEIVEQMNITSDAIIINQCEEHGYKELEQNGRKIRFYSFPERGIGLSRNNALMRADGDIVLFADEDMEYYDGYEYAIIKEFEDVPAADMILFNVNVGEERKTFYNTGRRRVKFYNAGRYGAVSFAIRTDRLKESRVTFSTLFGGGARYSAGEDSLFLNDFMDKGYTVWTSPIVIGEEKPGESTWFEGYHEKFFFDRGVLYYYLYGKFAVLFSLRYLLVHRKKLLTNMSFVEAYTKMREGICHGGLR